MKGVDGDSNTHQCKWSRLPGNGTTDWTDARLTPTGVRQAEIAHDFWQRELVTSKIPAPESYYSSPLWRCLSTANITFANLPLPGNRPFRPVVKEVGQPW